MKQLEKLLSEGNAQMVEGAEEIRGPDKFILMKVLYDKYFPYYF
ncbi:hypothetical protein ACFVAD_17080 [Sutcliffiella sp. NPDC057660]